MFLPMTFLVVSVCGNDDYRDNFQRIILRLTFGSPICSSLYCFEYLLSDSSLNWNRGEIPPSPAGLCWAISDCRRLLSTVIWVICSCHWGFLNTEHLAGCQWQIQHLWMTPGFPLKITKKYVSAPIFWQGFEPPLGSLLFGEWVAPRLLNSCLYILSTNMWN